MKSKVLGLLIVGLLAGPVAANATSVTINAADFAPGTNITHATLGVTLQWIDSVLDHYDAENRPVYAFRYQDSYAWDRQPPSNALPGDPIYGPRFGDSTGNVNSVNVAYLAWSHLISNGERRLGYPVAGFSAVFDTPVKGVSFTGSARTDWPVLYLFGVNGEFLGSSWSLQGSGNFSYEETFPSNPECRYCGFTYTMSGTAAQPIGSIVFGATMAFNQVETLTFWVPEPGTLALFGLGLAGLGLSRRRKA